MARRKRGGFWGSFFKGTHDVYRVQRAARTYRVWSSGSPKRIRKLYERRFLYKLFAYIANKLVR